MDLNELENLNKQFKITKIVKLLEVNNSMTHCWYYAVYTHLINKEQTRFKRIAFVIRFDAFDIMEYFDKECYSQSDINCYKSELAYSTVYGFLKDDIFNKCKDFIEYAQESIDNYNEIYGNY